jgi:HK97 family phage major capsid protein
MKDEFRKLGPEQRLAQLRGTKGERRLHIERKAIDEKARTTWLSIASDAPYSRWWGIEILSFEPGAIRTERLASGAPLLVGHDTADQVGVIEEYEIAGKRLRVKARFGRGARAAETFDDVVDGIRVNASVGYVIHDLELVGTDDATGADIYRVTDWEPLEGSLVAVPADHTVGVGRSHSINFRGKIDMDKGQEHDDPPAPRAGTVEAEQERVRSLLSAGREYAACGGDKIAMELAQDPTANIDTFKARILDKQRGAQKSLNLGGDPAGGWQHSGGGPKVAYGEGLRLRYAHGPLKAFRDVAIEGGGTLKAQEAAYRAGMWLAAAVHDKSWAKQWCRSNGMPLLYRNHDGEIREIVGAEIRAQNENVLSAGAALVPIEMEAAVIQLRDAYGAARRLCRLRPMTSDTLKIPRRKTGLTAYFFQDDDGVGITESSKNWDNVTLSVKKLGVLNKISRDLAEDSVISVVDDAAQEMAYAFAIKEDNCLLVGDGTSTYGGMQGIINKMEATTYISRYAAAAAHNTFANCDNADLTGMLGAAAQYADTPQSVIVCSNFAKHMLFNRLKAIAGGNRVGTLDRGPDNTYLGYEIVTSEAMPKVSTTLANKVMLLFGRFDLASSMGARRGIEVQVLMERYAELGQIGVIASERFDIVVHDLGTTSTSDVNGGKGPVSALYGTT